jgi:hypothetical protein
MPSWEPFQETLVDDRRCESMVESVLAEKFEWKFETGFDFDSWPDFVLVSGLSLAW